MILLTGATGFVGSHLLRGLVDTFGASNVVAYTSRPIHGVQCILHENYTGASNRFADLGFGRIEVVIHAGAFIPKGRSDLNDDALNAENLRTTRFLLEGQLAHLKRFVFVSTVDVYQPGARLSEASPVDPATSYGRSKRECEQFVEDWARERAVPVQILRLGHIYGPGEQAFQKIIPLTMRRALRAEPITMYGEGAELRSFLFITDLVRMVLASLNIPTDSGPVNLVSGQSTSIRDLIQLIAGMLDPPPQVVTQPSPNPGHDVTFDNTYCQRLFRVPETPLREGLAAELDHMRRLYGK